MCGWGSVFRLDCVCELLQASAGVFNKSWAAFCQGNLREKTFDTIDRMLQRKPSNVSDKARNKPKVKPFFFQKQTVCPSIMVKGDITQVLTVRSLNSLLFCFDLFCLQTNEFANYEKLTISSVTIRLWCVHLRHNQDCSQPQTTTINLLNSLCFSDPPVLGFLTDSSPPRSRQKIREKVWWVFLFLIMHI